VVADLHRRRLTRAGVLRRRELAVEELAAATRVRERQVIVLERSARMHVG